MDVPEPSPKRQKAVVGKVSPEIFWNFFLKTSEYSEALRLTPFYKYAYVVCWYCVPHKLVRSWDYSLFGHGKVNHSFLGPENYFAPFLALSLTFVPYPTLPLVPLVNLDKQYPMNSNMCI
jgi:hypothetical protein